ncbi:MAG: SDR family oxidoreductase [Oscillospiraceae bacterium]|jgi:NAD(P)-dependent dehydrogenase (short-subunit alcohol dehydrogenase family)|nr:SDR family oxidoreductase [Oscillospiraceae bacterium]
MSNRFCGKIAWITGAENAVAKAIAAALYQEGASLLLSGAKAVPAGIEPAEGQFIIALPEPAKDESAAKAALSQVERVDLVITGAREPDQSTIAGGNAALFDHYIDANLTSVFCALHAAAGKMGMHRPCAMLVLASIHGEKPSITAPLFSIANGGLNMLVKEAAQDLGRAGYRINMLRYGPLIGDEALFLSEESGLYHNIVGRVPRGAAATPEEIAKAGLLLLSEDASFINGAIVTADGGFLGHYLNADAPRRWENGFGQPGEGDAQ